MKLPSISIVERSVLGSAWSVSRSALSAVFGGAVRLWDEKFCRARFIEKLTLVRIYLRGSSSVGSAKEFSRTERPRKTLAGFGKMSQK